MTRRAASHKTSAPALPTWPADEISDRLAKTAPPRTSLLLGPDASLQKGALDALLGAIRARCGDSVEIVRVSALGSEKGGDGWDVASVFDEIRTPMLFSGERVLVVQHAGALGKDLLQRVAVRLAEGDSAPGYLVLVDATAEAPAPRAGASRASGSAAVVVSCGDPPRGRGAAAGDTRRLEAAARERCRQFDKDLSAALARRLVERIGADRAALDAAIEVLVSRVGSGRTIPPEAVEELDRLPRGGDSWAWVDATIRGDVRAALASLRSIFDWGIRFRGEARRRRGESELGPPLIGALASRLRMVEERGWPRRMDAPSLQRVTAILLRADRAMKGGWSTLGAYGALERATIEICRIVHPAAWRHRQGRLG